MANGASCVSIETMGGKSVSDYGIARGDPKAILFGIGVLGSIDMEYMWKRIVDICKKYDCIPAGDTDCAQANTAMFMAGGLLDKDCSHTSRRTYKGHSRCKKFGSCRMWCYWAIKRLWI